MRVEVDLEGTEPADDVLRRIRPVDTDDALVGAVTGKPLAFREHRGTGPELVELGGVDRDRRGGHGDAAAVVTKDVSRPVRGRPDDVFGRAHEVPPPAARVKADDV